MFDGSWRQWLAAFPEAHLGGILQGGIVLEIGLGPQVGLIDTSLGMGGPLWDLLGSRVTCVGGWSRASGVLASWVRRWALHV